MSYLNEYGVGLGVPFMMHPVVMIVMIWALVWKGLALWHSAKRGEMWWFVALLIVNTAGILEIVYLFVFAKLKFDQLFGSVMNTMGPKSQTPPNPNN